MPTDRFRFRVQELVLVLLTLAAYANSFRGTWMFDDRLSIGANPSIRSLWPLQHALFAPVQSGTAGRPLLNLSFALNYAFGGLQPAGYHAFNLAVHVLAALTLFGLLRRTLAALGGDAAIAWPATALWALHPLQTEAITYISQRAESLMALFYLLTVYGFIRFATEAKRLWAWASVAACLAGMLCKEVMLTAPLIVLLFDRFVVAGTFGEALRQRRLYYAALAICWLPLVALLRGVASRGVGLNVGLRWWRYGLAEGRVILEYLRLTLWPHPLVLDYGTRLSHSAAADATVAAVVGAALLTAAWAFARRKVWGLVALCFFVLLAPTSSIISVSGQPMAEHRMYLALAACTFLVTSGIFLLGRRSARVIAGVSIGAFAVLTIVRNRSYASEEAMWRETAAAVPSDERAHYNLGYLYFERGDAKRAIAEYGEAVRLNPAAPKTHVFLGDVLATVGRPEEGIAEEREALRLDPQDSDAHAGYAKALLATGKNEACIAEAKAALQINPQNADAHCYVGTALAAENHPAEAINEFELAVHLNPDDTDAHSGLGKALLAVGKAAAAEPELRAEVLARPQSADAHNNLGCALGLIANRRGDAIAEFETALRLKPQYVEARCNLAYTLANLPGRLQEAIEQYRIAEQQTPDDAAIHLSLASAWVQIPGHTQDSANELEQVLRLQPRNEAVRRLLDRIRPAKP